MTSYFIIVSTICYYFIVNVAIFYHPVDTFMTLCYNTFNYTYKS